MAQDINTKPETAAIAPINPRSFAPTQTATPTMFGPGMNWQRLKISANSSSFIHHRYSTAKRRTQTIPPPKLQRETLRNVMNSATSVTCSADFRSSAIRAFSRMIRQFRTQGARRDQLYALRARAPSLSLSQGMEINDRLPGAPRELQPPEAAQVTRPAMRRQLETPSRASTCGKQPPRCIGRSPAILHRSARVPTRSGREWSRYCDRSIIDPHRQRRQR
jgi:hypothetical protein